MPFLINQNEELENLANNQILWDVFFEYVEYQDDKRYFCQVNELEEGTQINYPTSIYITIGDETIEKSIDPVRSR